MPRPPSSPRLRVRSRGGAGAEGGGTARQLATGFKALGAQPVALALVLFCALDSAVYGASTVLYVPLSIRLGTGPDGYGYLLAAAALGGVLGAGLANRLSRASRLAPVIMGSLCLQALPFLLTVPVHSPALAAVLQVASGVGMIIVDVLAITSLQRDLAGDVLSRVLGIFDTLVLGAILLASLAAGILLAHADVNAALIAVGAGIPVIGLIGLPVLLRADRTSAVVAERLRPRVALLSELDLLADADQSTLERLAKAAEEVVIPAGGVVIREGDEADALWILTRGVLSIHVGGPEARELGAGHRARLRGRDRAAARHPAHRHRAGPPGQHAAADRRPGLPSRAASHPAQSVVAIGRGHPDCPHSRT